MKKFLMGLGAFLFVLFIIICFAVYYYIINPTAFIENHGGDYEMVTYTATYESPSVLKGYQNYEVVSDSKRYKELMKDVSHKSSYKYNDSFFRKNDLLVVDAGIDPEVHSMKITKSKVDMVIYYGSPLGRYDDEWSFSLILIPIEKNISDIHIQTTTYPDRMY